MQTLHDLPEINQLTHQNFVRIQYGGPLQDFELLVQCRFGFFLALANRFDLLILGCSAINEVGEARLLTAADSTAWLKLHKQLVDIRPGTHQILATGSTSGAFGGYLAQFRSLPAHSFREGHERLLEILKLLHRLGVLEHKVLQGGLSYRTNVNAHHIVRPFDRACFANIAAHGSASPPPD
jgi:hypothetical protein